MWPFSSHLFSFPLFHPPSLPPLPHHSSSSPKDVDRIFGNLTELHELSVRLLGDLDDCIEMSGEIGGESSVPQAGIIFEDLAEVSDVE